MSTTLLFGVLAATSVAQSPIPSECKVSVVGSGISGVYFAWRLAVDTNHYEASDVCVFEANNRLGGRMYSVRNYPEMGDLQIDVGAYRFDATDHLPADLITNALKLKTACYEYNCTGEPCKKDRGSTPDMCRKVVDVFGNSRFSLTIEVMLEQLENGGARLIRGVKVKGVHGGDDVVAATGKKKAILSFMGRPEQVVSEVVLVNTPLTAIQLLDADSVMFPMGGGSDAAWKCIAQRMSIAAVKVYAMYEDAWWYSKLGLMNGDFGDGNESVPLRGKYQNGPTRCSLGHGADGHPVYSDGPEPFGNCWGSLMVFYEFQMGGVSNFWFDQVTQYTDALTRILPGSEKEALIGRLHTSLMAYHAEDLAAVGVNPSTIAPPKAIYIGSFSPSATYVGAMAGTACQLDEAIAPQFLKIIRRPNEKYNVFFSNQDFGLDIGWATSGLQLSEKILQAEMNVHRPSWLDKEWYEKFIEDVA